MNVLSNIYIITYCNIFVSREKQSSLVLTFSRRNVFVLRRKNTLQDLLNLYLPSTYKYIIIVKPKAKKK